MDIYACMHKRISIHIYTYICIDNFLREREREIEREGKGLIPLKLGRNLFSFIKLNYSLKQLYDSHPNQHAGNASEKTLFKNAKAESWGRPFKDQHTSFFTPSLPRAQRHLQKP